MSCPECGAEFDGPVPDDALVPDALVPDTVPGTAAVEAASPEPDQETEPLPEAILDAPTADTATAAEEVPETSPLPEPPAPSQEASVREPALEAAAPEPPLLETVRPAPEELPYQRSTYQPPPYIPPPAYAPPPTLPSGGAQAYTAKRTPPGVLPKVLLIAAPIVLILVVGGLIFSHNLDGGSDTTPPPMPVTAPDEPLRPAAAPVGSPTIMAGGTTTGAGDSRVQWLAGRWQAKNTDFYVFNANGSGSQGSVTGKLPTQNFLWRIVGSQLMLYGAPKDQQVRFGVGPDDNTVYLHDSAGKPVQFTREVQNAAQKQ